MDLFLDIYCMTDYKKIRKICESNSRISERVVDDFLLAYAARHQGLEKKMNVQFDRYRHVISKFEKAHVQMFKSQFIIHRVFREGGLIGKFMRNPALERFKGEERDFLKQQVKVPWRFSFSEIIEEPEKDFFRMRDVFSSDEYLLFSPSTTGLAASSNPLLWFNLIGFNGACWQSFGPIGAFNSFGPDDIFFYATERKPGIEEVEELCLDIEDDPLPYILLHSGAAYPRTFNKKDEMLFLMAEHDLESLDTAGMKNKFKTEYDNGVYRLTHHTMGAHPHFAQAYYDEGEQLLLFSAMTRRGFDKLVRDFNATGHNFPEEAYLKVRLQMITTAGNILKREIVLNEYEELFRERSDPKSKKAIDDINAFVSLVLPDINAGRVPDIEKAARKAGVHMDTARDVADMIMGKRNEMPGTGADAVQGVLTPEGSKHTGKVLSSKDSLDEERLREIYTHARSIREMEPWKKLYETDLFGVKMPGSGQVYYISVMGASGEYTAVAAYIGFRGLSGFMQLQEEADSLPPWTILTVPHLMLAFTDRGEMDRENLAAINKAGLSFRGKGQWPKLDETVPGFVPVFPKGEALEDLPVLLEQVASVLTWARDKSDQLYREGDGGEEIMIRTPTGKPGNLRWENRYETPDPEKGIVRYKMTYRRDSCAEVSRMPVAERALQVDLALMLSPVQEKGKRGYFPFVLLLVDKESGMVSGMAMLDPKPDLDSMYESLPQKLLEEIRKMEARPERIELRSDLLFGLVEGALKEAWCKPVLVKKMPLMDEVIDSLMDHLNGP